MTPVHKSQSKIFKDEDDEFAATLRNAELIDHNNCNWLSSGGESSPSSCHQDNTLSGHMDLKIDAWLISLLSTPSTKSREISSTKATFFDGSRVNPIEEASLVLDQRKYSNQDLFFHENFEEEEEVVSWLVNDSSSVSSITDSSDDFSFSSCSSSSDYSSEVVDLEEIGTNKPLFWPSDWTCDWDSETKGDFFTMSPRKDTYKFNSDKVCNRRLVFGMKNTKEINEVQNMRNKASRFKKPTKTSTKIVPLDNEADFEKLTEAEVINETKTKTPIFWPSGCASEWGSDAKLDFFVMSPRKDIYSFGKSKTPKTSPDTNLRLQVLNGNMVLEKGCSRRLEFNSCAKTEVKPLTTKSVRKHRIVLEDLLLVDKLNVDGAIEEALGLGEFDGLEGLETEFNKDAFSLDEVF
ncbi:hypothetical protein L1887_01783 [Cichorium endivia]|nr:hypothetical protein L1887_01783 [Cichorium endivia]